VRRPPVSQSTYQQQPRCLRQQITLPQQCEACAANAATGTKVVNTLAIRAIRIFDMRALLFVVFDESP
jgi:hypothetical protein